MLSSTACFPTAWNRVIGKGKVVGVKPKGWPGMGIKSGFYSSSVTELLNLSGCEAPAVSHDGRAELSLGAAHTCV